MTSTLTDRYVHATLRTVPPARREEIGSELRASVSDMVEDRVAAGEPEADAERAVLTELGDPDRLAVRYTGMNQVLIGPRYFLIWWRLLVRLLAVVPAIVAVVVAIVEVAEGTPGAEVTGAVVASTLSVAVHVAFWTTLAFAIIDRWSLDVHLPEWDLDALPDVRPDRDVSTVETVAAVGFYVALIVATVVQHFASWITDDAGDRVTFLDPDLWSFWLPVLIGVVVLCIVQQVVLWARGRWTYLLATTNSVLAVAVAAILGYLLVQGRFFSDGFAEAVGMSARTETMIGTWVTVGLALAIAYEVVESFVRAARASRERRTADVIGT